MTAIWLETAWLFVLTEGLGLGMVLAELPNE